MSDHADMAFPRGALLAAAALIGFSLLMTAAVRVGVLSPMPSAGLVREQQQVKPLVSMDLQFLDRQDGAVVIQKVDGTPVRIIAAGTKDGFVRGVMRGLARERTMNGVGQTPAFRLTRWADGSLTLKDMATGRLIELGSFGPTNRATFDSLLPESPQ